MRLDHHVRALAVAGLLLGAVGTARAQDSTTGAVTGQVRDQANGEAVVGATIVATGAALQGTQATITEEGGQYTIANLPPGTYQLVIYYADAQFSRPNVLIQLGKVAKVNVSINSKAGAGETIVIQGRAPLIDQQSTKTGTTITQDYTQNVPTGRTFGQVLGAVGGSENDFYGTTISGSTSIENTYIVDGLNTTDPGLGLLTTNLPNEFVQETEVITGGYNAEYGRSTGGVINVITKSGSNELHGSAYSYWKPGALVAESKAVSRAGSSIDRENNLSNQFDVGAEVGGPIVKDRLWFHAGVNPTFLQEDMSRIVKTQVDRDSDGQPDVDENGFNILEPVKTSKLPLNRTTYYYEGKLTGAVTPDHQGSFSLAGSPTTYDQYGNTTRTQVTGTRSSLDSQFNENILDTSAKWTSKFFDNKTQVDAVVGFHFDDKKQKPGTALGDSSQIRFDPSRSLTEFSDLEQQDFGAVPEACMDGGANDPYPMIVNCPVTFYRTGGLAFNEDTKASRQSALLSVTQRVQGLGHHVFKVGADVEQQRFLDSRYYPGGALYIQKSTYWQINRFNTPDTNGTIPCGIDFGNGSASCREIENGDELSADTHTRNYSTYAQDSWSILPNLTVNAGLRWEQQTLFTADGIAGKVSPTTGKRIPDVALKLNNMVAPRIGLIYDPTQEGRAKVYGHYGRFYESIPMDINSRAYGGEVTNIHYLAPAGCDPNVTTGAANCNETNADTDYGSINYGGGEELVAPGLDAQYMDEQVLGAEYEILPDFKIGAAYIRRNLGRVIEDVSTDGAATYIIANPGEVDQAAVADLRSQAMQATAEGRMADAAFLNYKADTFEGVGIYDKPKRTYNALQITAEHRFTRNFFLAASYTYSQTRGNYPGLFSHETNQLDPNITSLYDLPELMGNRYGNLGDDRPHLVKLDGFYRLAAQNIGFFTFGASARAQSGIPINTLGAHSGYGPDESYILERGTGGRIGLTTRFDTHVAYGRALSEKTRLEAFFDVFNLFNQQAALEIDESYTFDAVSPIVGGDRNDLSHLKVVPTSSDAHYTRNVDGNLVTTAGGPELNPNYTNTFKRQEPLSLQFGLRYTF